MNTYYLFKLLAIWTFLSRSRCETISYSDNIYTFALTRLTTYTPNFISKGVFNSSIHIKEIAISVSNTYILDSDSRIEVHSRTDPTTLIRNINDYQFNSSIQPLSHVVYSLDESMVLLVRPDTTTLSYGLYSIDGNTWTFKNATIVNTNFTPLKVTMRGQYIFAYQVNMTGDVVHFIDYMTGLISNVSLGSGITNYSVDYTPDRQKAIIWSNENTKFQVRMLNTTFTLLYTDSNRLTSTENVPKNISFSADSQLAIIQYDGTFPAIVFSLTNYSITGNIIVGTKAYSAVFLDNSSRFVLIRTDLGDRIYDIQTSYSIYYLLNSTLPSTRISVDYQHGFLYISTGWYIYCYGINITSNDPVPLTPIESITTIQKSFYTHLNLTQNQQAVLFYIDSVLTPINTAIDYSFAFIFSSPLAIVFLSTFNYFSLSSLYILLNIRVPQEIFNYFGPLFESVQTPPLNYVDSLANWSSLSDQKVTDLRAIYFAVSSDLFSKNYIDLMVITANIILLELLILLSSKKLLNIPKIHKAITAERTGIYWGLLVSHMINFILPWRFSINGGVRNFVTKINLGVQHLAFCLLVVLIIFSLVDEVRNIKRAGKKHYLKISMRNWWASYQNFIYPLLVVNNSPYYFFVVIGLGQLFYFFNSLTVPYLRALAIMKALYPIVFHACFIVFELTLDNMILSYTTIICLGVFLLGSMHYLLQSVIMSVHAIYKALKQLCSKGSKNQISNIKKNEKKLRKTKSVRNPLMSRSQLQRPVSRDKPNFLMKLVNLGRLKNKVKDTTNQRQTQNKQKNKIHQSIQNNMSVSKKKNPKKVQISQPEDIQNFNQRGQKNHKNMIKLSESSNMSNQIVRVKIKQVKNPKPLMKNVGK